MNREQIEKLFLTARKNTLLLPQALRARASRFGDWNSPFSDEGLDFNEVKEYEAGDKLKDLDRVSYMQNRELMTIHHEATKELKTLIVVDMSLSMRIREEKLKMLIAVFSRFFYSMLDLYIPVNFWFISDENEFSKVANMNIEEYWYEIRDIFTDFILLNSTEEESARFDKDDWSDMLPPKSLIFVISDFLGKEKDRFLGILDEFSYDNYVLPVVVQDKLEYSFLNSEDIPIFGGTILFSDSDYEDKNRNSTINKSTVRDTKLLNENRFNKLQEQFIEKDLNFIHINAFDWPDINDNLQDALDEII